MTGENKVEWISGFWRRIGALIIDSVILGIVGQILGLFMEGYLVGIGSWGRMVGFIIALVYFGVLNSNVANGQTPGKKILKLRVVDKTNEPISIPKSIARYSILAIPFSLNGVQFSNEFLTSFGIYIVSLLVFGGIFSIFYLYVFNRVTRQSLHDIIVGTYVVNIGVEKQPRRIWKPHYMIVAFFLITAFVAPIFTGKLAGKEPFVNLLNSRKALMENPSVKSATVSYGKSTFTSSQSGTSKTTYVSAQVSLFENDISNEEFARSLAKKIADSYPDALNKDVIQINLIYGYDIGIASRWNNHTHRFSPNDL